MSILSLVGLAARFPAVAANPVGALLFSKNFWKFLLILAVAVGIYFGMKHMYDSHMELKDQVVAVQEANTQLKNDLSEKDESIKTLKASAEAQAKAIDKLNKRAYQNANALDALRKKFSDRDIGYAASVDPVAIEIEVNQTEKDRVRCYQLATGAKQNEGEVNTVCPQLLKQSQPR